MCVIVPAIPSAESFPHQTALLDSHAYELLTNYVDALSMRLLRPNVEPDMRVVTIENYRMYQSGAEVPLQFESTLGTPKITSVGLQTAYEPAGKASAKLLLTRHRHLPICISDNPDDTLPFLREKAFDLFVAGDSTPRTMLGSDLFQLIGSLLPLKTMYELGQSSISYTDGIRHLQTSTINRRWPSSTRFRQVRRYQTSETLPIPNFSLSLDDELRLLTTKNIAFDDLMQLPDGSDSLPCVQAALDIETEGEIMVQKFHIIVPYDTFSTRVIQQLCFTKTNARDNHGSLVIGAYAEKQYDHLPQVVEELRKQVVTDMPFALERIANKMLTSHGLGPIA